MTRGPLQRWTTNHSKQLRVEMEDKDGNSLIARPDSVLVLGHTGFIGRKTSCYLESLGYYVIGASSAECDLLDPASTRQFLGELPARTAVVFCSGIVRSSENTYDDMLENMAMVRNFVAGAPKGRLASVIYLGATSLYGPTPQVPIDEDTAPRPVSFYDISKLANEFLLRMPGALDCPVTILRLPGIYGEGDRGKSVVGLFLKRMRLTGNLTIFGDGTSRRDFVAVEDITEVIRQVLEKPFDGILNVASGTSISMQEVVDTIAHAAGLTPTIDYGPPDLQAPSNLVFDTNALQAWLPELKFRNLAEGSAAYAAAINEEKLP